jgi:hypothetical protein
MQRKRGGIAAALITLTAGAVLAPAMAWADTFQTIDNTADPTFNQLLGINNSGTIAGYFGSGALGHPNQGYTVTPPYAQANFTAENFPSSVQTQVTGINNIGTTVGFWSNSAAGTSNFGFVDSGGRFTNVNDPLTPAGPPSVNQLLGVNDHNVAVGFYNGPNGNSHGYTYNIASGTFSAPINDPLGVSTTTAAINNAGQLAGFYVDANNVTHGFLDNGGVFTTYDAPGATATMLLGLNNEGEAVGVETTASGLSEGLILNIASDTWSVVNDPNGIGTTTLNGINDQGQIVGFYVDAAGNTDGLLMTVPEPASLLLLVSGITGLAAFRRTRRG